MTSYFVLSPAENRGIAENEHALDFGIRLDFEPGRLTEWPNLRWVSDSREPSEWLFTTDSVRLVSPRIRMVLDRFITAKEDVQWLPGKVRTPAGEELPYFVPHFATWHDVLDEKATFWGPNGPIRWGLSEERFRGLSVFTLPKKVDIVIVTAAVLEALQESGATGYDVQRARVA